MVSWPLKKPSKRETVRSKYASLKAPLVKHPANRPKCKKRKIHYVFKGSFANLQFTWRGPRCKTPRNRPRNHVSRTIFASTTNGLKPLETKRETYARESGPLPGDQIPLFQAKKGTKSPDYSIYRVFGWNRNYEGIAVPIPAKHFINGVWLE